MTVRVEGIIGDMAMANAIRTRVPAARRPTAAGTEVPVLCVAERLRAWRSDRSNLVPLSALSSAPQPASMELQHCRRCHWPASPRHGLPTAVGGQWEQFVTPARRLAALTAALLHRGSRRARNKHSLHSSDPAAGLLPSPAFTCISLAPLLFPLLI